MKAHYDQKPKNIERIAPGQYLFNWDIEPNMQDGEQVGWVCNQVDVRGLPNYERIVRAIIRQRWDETEEFAIVNKYNAWKLGLCGEDAREAYEEFLTEVEAIKQLVRNTDITM